MVIKRKAKPCIRFRIAIPAAAAVACLVTLASCGGPPATSLGALIPPECVIVAGPNHPADSVVVALLDPVDPQHAPYPRNSSERILFRHLYQTLIGIDCRGNVRALLASSWKKSEGGRAWSFELSGEARFWDGSPVSAGDVVECWRAAKTAMTAHGIDSASAVDDRTVVVHFQNARREVPLLFSDSEFFVVKPAADSKWPIGSGPYQVVTSKKEAGGMFKRTITAYPHRGGEGPVIQFVEASGHDARDLLGGVVDMMVTMDPSVIDFAKEQPDLETSALPWDRTYTLVSASRFRELWRGGALDPIPPELSVELARDAVRSEARPCASPPWWENPGECKNLYRMASEAGQIDINFGTLSGSPRLLYDSSDPVARDISERIIALAMTEPGTSPAAAALITAVPDVGKDMESLIAQGLDEKQLLNHLKMGSDFAYIIQIPCNPVDPCAGARKLIDQIPWAAGMHEEFGKIFVPLVDTRPHAITNRERLQLSVDWNGNVVIMNGIQPER